MFRLLFGCFEVVRRGYSTQDSPRQSREMANDPEHEEEMEEEGAVTRHGHAFLCISYVSIEPPSGKNKSRGW